MLSASVGTLSNTPVRFPIASSAWQAPGRLAHIDKRRSMTSVQAASGSSPGSSRSVLDAFFYGKAFAEVVNERLGVVADDLLLEFNKRDAERRQAFREFLDQVQSRAESQMLQSSTTSSTSSTGVIPPSRQLPGPARANGTGAAQSVNSPSPDLQETVDELRAEVATTRAELVKFRNKRQTPRLQ